MTLSGDLEKRLMHLAKQDEDAFDLLEAALVISKVLQPSGDINTCREKINILCQCLHQIYKEQLSLHPPLIAKTRALQKAMVSQNGFHGEDDAFDELDQMNLFSVMEHKCATAVTLALIYIHCTTSLGWTASALNFPAYCLIRLDQGAERKIIDPFNNCVELDAFDLRQFIKVLGGAEAELQPDFYDSLSPKTLALRHINAVKMHFLRCEQIDKAIEVLSVLTTLEATSSTFWREMGLLQARLARHHLAIESLKKSINFTVDSEIIRQTQHIIDNIHKKIE